MIRKTKKLLSMLVAIIIIFSFIKINQHCAMASEQDIEQDNKLPNKVVNLETKSDSDLPDYIVNGDFSYPAWKKLDKDSYWTIVDYTNGLSGSTTAEDFSSGYNRTISPIEDWDCSKWGWRTDI